MAGAYSAVHVRRARSEYGTILPDMFHRLMPDLEWSVLLEKNKPAPPSTAESKLVLIHTSFTLSSYLEFFPFTKDSGNVFRSLQNADGEPVPGLVGHSGMIAPWVKTLDTITLWTSLEHAQNWYRSGLHAEIMKAYFSGKKFSKSPQNFTERLWIAPDSIPESGDYEQSKLLWESVLNGKLEPFDAE
eukprot:CAMPEP_0185848222 /NCGR_PEP_ID=MMETSP1354-20130828/3192_1 /TAXON_ID=708628 /ORGANISM="Erythrolobus madagascarensis, Strain CCMP3276" /LENGTH=186 /DNA_ID=CAMNT_0028548599 /DNA_START=199 /DNA_END=759 /DNA_ORIENTATION=-